MRYQNTIDIWAMQKNDVSKLQPGQWVKAGPNGNRGIYLGVKASGSIVVAWHSNATSRQYRAYIRALRNYATA